ncbi:MAG: ion transporter [Acidimicrobiia bacterium]|nr:ion transporter [Acidimicrobiia bacterium]
MITQTEGWRPRTRRIIFEADTTAGQWFDIALMALIIVSVFLVMFESVPGVTERYESELLVAEWAITIVFTIEYVARLLTVERPSEYARSFFGVIDLLAVLPVYVSLIIPGAQSLLVIRSLRLLRVFRVFKMAHWLREANYLLRALRASTHKIAVFLITVALINVVVGSTMYVIEGPERGFDSMFRGVYWSVVTMSTVGFGDIAPSTGLGQVLAAALMILGFSVIAVPTGIVSAELAGTGQVRGPHAECNTCGLGFHEPGSSFCRRCGGELAQAETDAPSASKREDG